MSSRYALASLAVVCFLSFPNAKGQQLATGQNFAVTSGHPRATAAGMNILRNGGNVIDAAIATSLALGVAEPYGSGLGGKLILLYREAQTGKVYSIVALCRSPGELDPDNFANLPSSQRRSGFQAVGVPGLPAGLHAAHARWGRLPWQSLIQPAIDIATTGVEINAKMQDLYRPKVPLLQQDSEAARLYLVDGEIPPVGSILKNPDLALTLQRLAKEGVEDFYRGQTAQRIVAAAKDNGAPLAVADFASYRPWVGKPLAINYRGLTILSCPQPLTGGVTVLSAMRLLEDDPFRDTDPHGKEHIDAVSRALLAIYPRVSAVVGDVPSAREATEALLRDPSTQELRSRSLQFQPNDPYGVEADDVRGSAAEASTSASTSHLCVVDRAGNMVSLTQSLSHHFGASVIAPGTGLLLNNSMNNFSTRNPEHVNYVAPGKVARSTIAPVLVTRDEQAVLALGIPGGQRIPTTTIQLLNDLLDFGLPLNEAFSQSRFHLRRPLTRRSPANLIDLEAGHPARLATELEELGWRTRQQRRNGRYFGGGSAISLRADGSLAAVGDERRTNHAAAE